jgi:nifR3 family TIM-barrel protein
MKTKFTINSEKMDSRINMGFWAKLPKPFFCSAPMADVTDAAFRQIISKCSKHGEKNGGPDVFWTEFVSADGLMLGGRESLLPDLRFSPNERPIVAQLFSSNVLNMKNSAKLCQDLGFDGIDINMGCPDRKVEKQGAGACMIKTPDVARAIIRAVKEGAPNLPVSVKTRVGYNKEEIDNWIPVLLSENISALTIHARTRKDMSKVKANWNYVRRVVEMRNAMNLETKIIGNGDVSDISDAIFKAKETGADGIMIGRAMFGNPWIFDKSRRILSKGKYKYNLLLYFLPRAWVKKLQGDDRYTISDVPIPEKLKTLVEHSYLFEEYFKDLKSFSIMKKHFKAYVSGFRGSKELRAKLMEEGNSASVVKDIIESYLKNSENSA